MGSSSPGGAAASAVTSSHGRAGISSDQPTSDMARRLRSRLGTWVVLAYIMGLGWSWIVLAVLVCVVSFFSFWFFRYSRMLWMALDMNINPSVQEDFEARER